MQSPGPHENWTPVQWLTAFVLRRTKPAYKVAAVVGMRDDGLYIIEWIAHYLALGVDNIYVYSNDNIDGSEGLLRALAAQGVITFIENRMGDGTNKDPQKKAFAHALHLLPELWQHEWVLFMDSDEFLVPDHAYDYRVDALIDDAVSRFPARAPSGICFNWVWYVSGRTYHYEPSPLLRRFQHAIERRGMKSLVRLRDIWSMHRVHFPEMAHGGFLVGSDFAPLDKFLAWKKKTEPVFGSGRLNHYWCKSFEEFSVKKARGDATSLDIWRREFGLFFTNNANETDENFQPSPEGLVVAVEAEIEKLMALPGIENLVDELRTSFPILLQRFDRDGGLRAIYENALPANPKLAQRS